MRPTNWWRLLVERREIAASARCTDEASTAPEQIATAMNVFQAIECIPARRVLVIGIFGSDLFHGREARVKGAIVRMIQYATFRTTRFSGVGAAR